MTWRANWPNCAATATRNGRPFDAIEKTALTQWNPIRKSPQQIVDQLGELRELGFDTVIASLTGVETLKPIEILARDVFPQAAPSLAPTIRARCVRRRAQTLIRSVWASGR